MKSENCIDVTPISLGKWQFIMPQLLCDSDVFFNKNNLQRRVPNSVANMACIAVDARSTETLQLLKVGPTKSSKFRSRSEKRALGNRKKRLLAEAASIVAVPNCNFAKGIVEAVCETYKLPGLFISGDASIHALRQLTPGFDGKIQSS